MNFEQIRKEAFAAVQKAASKGDLEGIAFFTDLAKRADAGAKDVQKLEALHSQLMAEISSGIPAITGVAPTPSPTEQMSAKAQGKHARQQWATKRGLTQSDGVIFGGPNGTAGIAYGAEKPDRPDRCFLGLPDKAMDAAVLLYQSPNGDVLDFVLPKVWVQKYWAQISRSGKFCKFNVRRIANGKFQLLLKTGWVDITPYLHGTIV